MNIVIKHSTYLRKPTSKENVACTKRHFETLVSRVNVKLKINMGRLTNPSYNFLAGSEIPRSLSVRNYVVFLLPDRFKEPTASSGYKKGSPKLIMRRKRMEFAMTRNSKEWGLRRVHSTGNSSSGKEPSYVRLEEQVLSGIYESNQLEILKSNIVNGQKCSNFSMIMADLNFLIAAWARIKFKQGNLTASFTKITLNKVNLSWFEKTANEMRNGKFQFTPSKRKYIRKSDGKEQLIIMPSLKDKVIQEAMQFLLLLAFKSDFSKNSYGWVTGRGRQTACNQIKTQFSQSNWYIQGDIEQQLSSLDHHILVEVLKTKINDQAFIDLIYKYLMVGYEIKPQSIVSGKIGALEGGPLFPVLANIYMTPFDFWVENDLIPNYIKDKRKRANSKHIKMIRNSKVIDHSIRLLTPNDKNSLKFDYVRYADNFILGLNSPKKYCERIILECKTFLAEKLKLTLNLGKTKIIHSQKDSALFLGYQIYKTKLSKNKVVINAKRTQTRIITSTVLDAPISRIVEILQLKGYVKRNRNPTRNGRLINHTLYEIIEHYKTVERGILQYYSLANNYGRVAARVHYILKYSCALTIASKMKLKTLRRVFNKYGRDICIRDEKGNVKTNYPTLSSKRPKNNLQISIFDYNTLESCIDSFDHQIKRERDILKGLCVLSGSQEKTEIHRV